MEITTVIDPCLHTTILTDIFQATILGEKRQPPDDIPDYFKYYNMPNSVPHIFKPNFGTLHQLPTSLGDRTFPVVAGHTWNALPHTAPLLPLSNCKSVRLAAQGIILSLPDTSTNDTDIHTPINIRPFTLFCGSVVSAMNLRPASLGSTPGNTHTSHWWRQEGHPAKTAPMHQ